MAYPVHPYNTLAKSTGSNDNLSGMVKVVLCLVMLIIMPIYWNLVQGASTCYFLYGLNYQQLHTFMHNWVVDGEWGRMGEV